MEVFAASLDVCTVQRCVYLQASNRGTVTNFEQDSKSCHYLTLYPYFCFKGHLSETFFGSGIYLKKMAAAFLR